jgi:rubredoxin
MFKKILGWVKGKPSEGSDLSVEIEMVKPEAPEVPPTKDKKTALKQPDPVCPHCGCKFAEMPASKRKCPECKKEVIVRSRNKIKTLMTSEEALQFDTEKKETARRKNLAGYLHMANLEFKSLDDIKGRLDKSSGSKWRYDDVVWKVLNEAVIEGLATKNYAGLQYVYFAMTHFLRDEGKDFFDTWQEMHRMQLMEYLQENSDYSVRVSTSCECPQCSAVKDKVFKVREALEKMPFPVKDCTNRFPLYGRYLVHS